MKYGKISTIMILTATGSPKLQDPNLVYSVLDNIYQHLSFNETLTIVRKTTLTGADSFVKEWVEERLKPQDRVIEIATDDIKSFESSNLAVIFFQEDEENKEVTKFVEMLDTKNITVEKYRSHNFLKGNH